MLAAMILAAVSLLLAQVATRGVPGSLPEPSRRLLEYKPDSCEAYLGVRVKSRLSVVLNADPGDFSGTPEARYILANLQDQHEKPRNETVCGLIYHGTIMGQPALAVTTGIGPTAAGLCVQELVTACGACIKDMVFSGTSGWSAQQGGTLNPEDCNSLNSNGHINRFGDVWVGPFSVDWSCKMASWTDQSKGYPNQCFRPVEENGPEVTPLFGNCIFYQDNVAANLKLSDEVLAAAKKNVKHFPKRTSNVTALEQKYFAKLGQYGNANFGEINGDALPTFQDYNTAVEVDSQFFFSGIPWDLVARDYVAETLSLIKNKTVKATEVINVNAMEGVGVSEAMEKYHKLVTTKRKIPYTYIRAMSDWVYQSVKETAPGVWQDSGTVVQDFPLGYGYAIATGSSTVLSLYQARCQQDVASGKLATDYDCSYKLDYQG